MIDKAGYFFSDNIYLNQPFSKGTCNCNQFRIPGIITLKSGHLFATADARWDNAVTDYGGIDTVFSVSIDNGKTWQSGYAAMFPDSAGTPIDPKETTTCIDPCVVEDKNGVIHILVNMNPSGITTGLVWPGIGNGFIEKNSKKVLALVKDYKYADKDFSLLPQDELYYLEENQKGYYNIYQSDGTKTEFTTDEFFNLYKNSLPIYQKQVNTDKSIQQNIFYKNSCFHIYNTMYTMHLTSSDEGKTWHNKIISDQIKLNSEDALISSPGNGTVTENGTLLMPFYVFNKNYTASTLIIYSEDNGLTWKRTPYLKSKDEIIITGESKVIDLKEKWRLILRNQINEICYADFDISKGEWQTPVKTGIKIHSDCNLSAIKKDDLLYISAPKGEGEKRQGRCNGYLFTFVLNNDFSMRLTGENEITNQSFSYSCLTQLDDSIYVLYDTCGDGEIIFKDTLMSHKIAKAKTFLTEYREECKKIIPFGKRTNICGVDCIIHLPKSQSDNMPVFLFLHGGSWVGGDAATLDSICKNITDGANCVSVNINYTKLDVKPFPYAMDEVIAVIKYLTDNKSTYNIDPNKFVICGCSAGGHLACATAVYAKQKGMKIARQIPIYPFTDWTGTIRNPVEDYGICEIELSKWKKLLFKDMALNSPCLSPAAAKEEYLYGIAPADFIICGDDELREHGAYYYKKLKEAGIDVTIKEYPKAMHGFFECNRPDFVGVNPCINDEQAEYAIDCEKYIIEIIKKLNLNKDII